MAFRLVGQVDARRRAKPELLSPINQSVGGKLIGEMKEVNVAALRECVDNRELPMTRLRVPKDLTALFFRSVQIPLTEERS